MSDEKVLNADLRELPIEIAGHTVTVDVLINVAAGLEHDLAFGAEYMNHFDVRSNPPLDELDQWLSTYADGEYGEMIRPQHRSVFLDRMGNVQAEVATAEIKAMAEKMGFHCMVLEVPVHGGTECVSK